MQRRFTVSQPRLILTSALDSFQVEIPRNRQFILELRRRVPGQERFWNPDLGTQGRWVVSDAYREVVREILEELYGEVAEVRE